MKTIIVIPAFNEEDNIVALVNKVHNLGYEYLVINDCSTDNTEEVLIKNKINHLCLPVNLGIAGVTRVGFKYAKDNGFDCVICIDGDGQHKPEYVEDLIKVIEDGADYVVGSRFVDEKKPVSMRMIGSRVICFLIKLKTGKTITDPTSGMRALGKKVIRDFAESMNYYAEPDALCNLLHKGYNVKEIQVEMDDRQGGVSYFHNPFKSIYYMIAVTLSIIFVQ